MSGIKGQPSPKPSQVQSPVPGDALASALDSEVSAAKPAKLQAPPQGQAPADDPLAAALDKANVPDEPQQGLVSQGLDAAGRVLDYPGGFARAGVFSAIKPGIVTEEDSSNIAKGKGPNSAEYLKRLGVNEGFSANIPLIGKVTQRGAEGLALDVVTDPLTLVAKTVKGIPYLKNLLNAPGQAAEALGEAVYKSAFPAKAKDAAAAMLEGVPEAGLSARSPIGGTAKLAQQVEDTSNTIGKLRQGLYDKATELGVTVDTAYPLKRAESVLEQMRRDPGLTPAADDLQKLLDGYKGVGKVPIDVMSEWKTNLYDALPQSAWDGTGGLRNKAKMFKSALAADFRDAIVQAGNAGERGLGDSINALNEKWGSLLSATRPLEKATQATGGKLGHIVDGAVLATGGLKAAAVKKGYDLATSPFTKTVVGNALMQAGRQGIATGVFNRAVINSRGGVPQSLQSNDNFAPAPPEQQDQSPQGEE